MVDLTSLFSLQARSRRNAGRAVTTLGAHRRDRAEADRAVDAAAGAPVVQPPQHGAALGRAAS